jgi:hypothetical protein
VSYVTVFRSRLRPGVEADYGVRGEQIYNLAIQMPGFIAIKDFVAEDGERVAIVEFDTAEHRAVLLRLQDPGLPGRALRRVRRGDRQLDQVVISPCP